MNDKTITIRIPKELHRDIKKEVAERDTSIKDYIVALINKDLYNLEEDDDDDDEIEEDYDDDPLLDFYPNEENSEERAYNFNKDIDKILDRS